MNNSTTFSPDKRLFIIIIFWNSNGNLCHCGHGFFQNTQNNPDVAECELIMLKLKSFLIEFFFSFVLCGLPSSTTHHVYFSVKTTWFEVPVNMFDTLFSKVCI